MANRSPASGDKMGRVRSSSPPISAAAPRAGGRARAVRRGIVRSSGAAKWETAVSEEPRGAVRVEIDGRSVVSDFGDPAAEYEALRTTAGVVELPWIERLRVSGSDRVG